MGPRSHGGGFSPSTWSRFDAYLGSTYGFHLPGTNNLYEIQANHGAAEALMPAWAVKEVGTSLGYDVARLARKFGVSRKAMEIRLEELGIRSAS
ncbi:MAG: ImmA/IrrE family metallo-endopeptidase [Limnochordales bacterium]|nr:ImmA/IrrE family metallo-endopeptidase [Limnochordales bacterium]